MDHKVARAVLKLDSNAFALAIGDTIWIAGLYSLDM